MKHWMAVHTFVDESAKLSYHKYMAEVEELKTKDGKSFTQSDWAKESTGEFATVYKSGLALLSSSSHIVWLTAKII